MDLLKLLINSRKTIDPCFLCFKNDKNNFDIHAVFEIHNDCNVISLSIADMFKYLFSSDDFVFMKTCNDCSDLICKLYILIHNRESKILLLDCIVKELTMKTNIACDIPLINDKHVINIEVPLNQELSPKDCVHNRDIGIYSKSKLMYISNNDICLETTNLHKDTQVAKMCPYCSETFLRIHDLKLHLKIHRKKRQRRRIYQYCNDCDYKTLSKTTLQAHVNKNHLNTRPHICQVCHKGFYNRSNLNEHIKTHNSQRDQVCELCGCSFLHKKSLTEHLRLHSDTKPYKCDICNKSFITSGRRSDHIKRSHMEKSECCLICNKKFSLKKELTRHVNNVHLRIM